MIGTTVGLRLGDFKMDFFHRGASCSTLSLLYGMIRNKNVKTHLWRTWPTTPWYNARHWKEGRRLKIADQISDHLRLRPGTLGTLDNPPRLVAKNSPRFENTCCTEGESHESVWLVRKVGLTQTAKNEKWEHVTSQIFPTETVDSSNWRLLSFFFWIRYGLMPGSSLKGRWPCAWSAESEVPKSHFSSQLRFKSTPLGFSRKQYSPFFKKVRQKWQKEQTTPDSVHPVVLSATHMEIEHPEPGTTRQHVVSFKNTKYKLQRFKSG